MKEDTIRLIVWSVFAALAAASVIAYIIEINQKKVAVMLIKQKAVDEQSAMTLYGLGFRKVGLLLASVSMKGGSRIKRAIRVIAPKAVKTENDLLFSAKGEAKYYLPEDAVDKSLKKHLSNHTPLWKLIAALLILLAAAYTATSVIGLLQRYATHVAQSFDHEVYGSNETPDTLLEEQEKLTEQDIKEAEEAAKEAEEEAKAAAEEAEATTDGETDDSDDTLPINTDQ